MTEAALRRAYEVLRLAKNSVSASDPPKGLAYEMLALEQGGVSLSFENEAVQHELVFVVPSDVSVLYFVARGTAKFRRAGIVVVDSAIPRLVRWLEDRFMEFPSGDLDIG